MEGALLVLQRINKTEGEWEDSMLGTVINGNFTYRAFMILTSNELSVT
jgi:hypothetical protein